MGDDWLAGEKIDVDIQRLDDFAAALMDELNANFTPSHQHGVVPLLQVQAPFGAGGMKEGQYFRTRHDHSRAAIQQLLADVTKGLASLSVAAKSISVGYLTEDALTEATNNDVFNAFSKVEGKLAFDSSWQQGDDGPENSADSLSEARFDSAATHLEENFIPSENGGSTERPPMLDQPKIIGEGAAVYQIQGDDEGMHADALAPPDIDPRG
ncbi:hypothetical protein [Salinispora mooreana]|uniref:hypothetical protein n=1 Tax=Salinispora mooreana TaxID=999545 RepID=UPI00037C0459|nr:hypothetical protein [Salinispora mooreana]